MCRKMMTTQTTEITTIEELEAGDKVTVSGNGLNITTEVSVIEMSSWSGTKKAYLEPEDGYTASLSDTEGPLMTDGIKANVGAVTVELHN